MSTISHLENLRKKIEAEVQRRLVAKIFDLGVEYHTRKGLRRDCDCDYCRTKVHATRDIGNMSYLRCTSREEVDYFREMKRNRWRREMRELKL